MKEKKGWSRLSSPTTFGLATLKKRSSFGICFTRRCISLFNMLVPSWALVQVPSPDLTTEKPFSGRRIGLSNPRDKIPVWFRIWRVCSNAAFGSTFEVTVWVQIAWPQIEVPWILACQTWPKSLMT
jgi:hypothetical protein